MTNTQLILDTLSEPRTHKEIETLTNIPHATAFRAIRSLVEDGKIGLVNGKYRRFLECPRYSDMYQTMKEYYSQRMMDSKFRRKKLKDRADEVLVWYVDNETMGIKGNINDYHLQTVENTLLLAYNMFEGEVLQYSQQ
jgi:hypothetical protein